MTGRTLSGTAASPGRAEGRFFVARSVADLADFPDGGILVTHESNPAWISGLVRAAGLVTEHGGVISHAAISARELGIPCVVGIPDVTTIVTTGQHGEVDGRSGTVSIHE